jgi:hypothetical protein
VARSAVALITLAIALVLAPWNAAHGFALHGYTWPAGTQVLLHLQLDRPFVPLQDGSPSWNASAADALATWNQYLGTVQLVESSPAPAAANDGVSEVSFSDDVYGMAWPTGTLAVTLYYSPNGKLFTETDVLFNNHLKWNSYRGGAQGVGAGTTWDLHRVALHEFGHVIGLDHPDEYEQNVVAIMNSFIAQLDHLADDDIAGARSLYPARITSPFTPASGAAGASFSYQITANNNPVSFGATGLPAGLQLNTTTGFISGTPETSGSFEVLVTAYGAYSNASANIRITIAPPFITSPANPAGVAIGNTFSYQITASGSPTSYSAIGLPPGLELNASTGVISGVPTISGTYSVTVIARGPYGEASTHITITFAANPPPRPFDTPAFTFPVGKGAIVTDPVRPRVYVGNGSSIAVVNTAPPGLVATIPIAGLNPVSSLSLSRDNNTLYFTRTNYSMGRIDLETLKALPDIPIGDPVSDVREGLGNRLYCASGFGAIAQVDATTGQVQARFEASSYSIEISPDGKTLYVAPLGPTIHSYDISGATPVLLHTSQQPGQSGNLGISGDGTRLSFWTGPAITLYDTADIEHPLGVLPSPYYGYDEAIFSPDNSLVFQLANPAPKEYQILVYSSASRQLVRTITLPPSVNRYRYLGVDASNTYVMACPATDNTVAPAALVLYSIVPQAPTLPPHSLLNVSTRMRAQGGDNALIGGFIINGQEPKQVAVRAMGPSLPVAGKLADPVLQLFDGTGALVAQNDNWNSHRADVIATGIPPSDEHEAVISVSLPPGSYTGVVRGVNDSAGVALIEAYDLTTASNSKLANISTRGKVEAGDNVMIGGFILGGDQATNVVVRAIGPSLATFGVPGTLDDPMLEVHDGNGVTIAQNDDWRSSQEQALIDAGLPPRNDREAALVLSLSPGPYTAIVRGKSDGVGVALVEVYNLEAN